MAPAWYIAVITLKTMDSASRDMKNIWTIGHSRHSIESFRALLQAYEIRHLADIRSFPGSHRYPQFNQAALAASLAQAGIGYTHIAALGGRQGAASYTGYMATAAFAEGLSRLESLAGSRTACMCAEAEWRECHRSKLSDRMTAVGWSVIHIRADGGSEAHVLQPVQGQLF